MDNVSALKQLNSSRIIAEILTPAKIGEEAQSQLKVPEAAAATPSAGK